MRDIRIIITAATFALLLAARSPLGAETPAETKTAAATAPTKPRVAFASEYELLRKLPPSILKPMVEGASVDADGFWGTHARYKTWYEAGMQRGGCWYLIAAVVAGDETRAEDAWRSIETTFAHQIEDGGFVSNQKPNDAGPPTRDARVETAYFYLQELGHALLVLRDSPMEPRFHDRAEALKPKILRACRFVQSGYDGIILKVGKTANRLLIAAKAMGLCGTLLGDDSLKATSKRLVEEALKRRDAEGVFIERGGRDSSYNSVSLLMGQILAFYMPDPELDDAFTRSMAWQRTRIKPTGEVDNTGNTRTGVGLEKGINGVPKGINYHEIAMALCYFGLTRDDPSALELAEKVDSWPGRAK